MQTASESKIDPHRRDPERGLQRWLEVGLIFAVFFILSGAPAPHINEAHYLTKAKHYWNPAWGAGDLFLDSADAHLPFFWSIGWLCNWFSLAFVAWIARLVAWLLLAISWQRLSSRVVVAPYASILTATLFVALIANHNFAGEWVVGGVEGKCFAYAFVFWGLAAIADSRWRIVWPLLGLASAFHVIVGGWSTICALTIWLRQSRADSPRLEAMLPWLLLGGLLALPGILPAIQLTAEVPAAVSTEANQIYVFHRLPHHLAPLTLPSDELAERAIRFGILLLGFCALGFLFQKAQRSALVSPKPDSPEHVDQNVGLARMFQFAEASLILFLLGAIWELATWNHPPLAAKLLKFYWFRLADVALPLVVSFAIVWQVYRLIRSHSKWATLALLLAAAYPGWHLYTVSAARWDWPAAPADRRIRNPLAWKEVCEWARQNTTTNDLFLVPRKSSTFKWYAGRNDLVTWKDVPQDANSLLIWRDRYQNVFAYTDQFGERQLYYSLAEQGTERIQKLAEKYGVDYVVTKEYPPLFLPVAFTNESFTIYATSPTSKASIP